MARKPTEGARAPRQMPSVGRKPKGLRVAQAIAGGGLLRSLPANNPLPAGGEQLI